jgi:hypothetical protein
LKNIEARRIVNREDLAEAGMIEPGELTLLRFAVDAKTARAKLDIKPP